MRSPLKLLLITASLVAASLGAAASAAATPAPPTLITTNFACSNGVCEVGPGNVGLPFGAGLIPSRQDNRDWLASLRGSLRESSLLRPARP